MGRPKSFDVDVAVCRVMRLCQERGYHNTSIRAIAEILGLSRSCIYATFGSRQNLFVTVLRRYGAVFRIPGLDELDVASEPRAALVKVFELAVARLDRTQRAEECLLVGIARKLDPGDSDSEIARIVRQACADMEARVLGAIKRGQGAGEITESVDPVQTAGVLLSLYFGLHVLRPDTAGSTIHEAVVRQVQALLPRPRRDVRGQGPSGVRYR